MSRDKLTRELLHRVAHHMGTTVDTYYLGHGQWSDYAPCYAIHEPWQRVVVAVLEVTTDWVVARAVIRMAQLIESRYAPCSTVYWPDVVGDNQE